MKAAYPPSWSVNDLPFDTVDRGACRGDAQLFLLLASASFVEITSHLYADALIDYFRPEVEIKTWLAEQWLAEETQHGVALKRYVSAVWPEFDWELSYRDYYREYSQRCHRKQLGPTWALEMAARCVVETGTASLYAMLHQLTSEPVLRALTAFIKNDEIRHYKRFYNFFVRFRNHGQPDRSTVARTLWKRILEVDREDGYLAFKHVFATCHPAQGFHETDYKAFCLYYRRLAKRHYPYEMAAPMLLSPLGLTPWLGDIAVSVLSAGAKQLTSRSLFPHRPLNPRNEETFLGAF